jgi:pimeloyl-ACP methyl ester carboxylesterase
MSNPLAHDRTGSGPPLLLIHGLGSNRHVWDAPLGLLQREREVVAIDLPGFGDSPALAVTPTPSALADALQETITELGLGRPAVAGNSLGGLLSLELARRNAVSSAVALSPAGFAVGAESRFASTSLAISRKAAGAIAPVLPKLVHSAVGRSVLTAQLVAHPSAVPPDEMLTAVSGLIKCDGFEATRKALFEFEWSHREALPVPVTVAWGAKDRLLLPRQARRAEAWIPGIRSFELPDCGHVPCWDNPPLVARTILEGTAAAR